MAAPGPAKISPIRFGPFDVDPSSGELRKHGVRLKLQGQPFQVLCVLLERPGEIITREELREKLWSADTFVDFDVGLNTAIKKVRDVLDDSAETPRFIETIPRRGYRFVYPLSSPASDPLGTQPRSNWRTAGLVVIVAAVLIALPIIAIRTRMLPTQVAGKTMRVAVLPLKNFSGDPQQDYFAAGMTEMLITELGRLNALQVTSHQSVLAYKDSTKRIPEIARELDVDAVIEGTVQRAGDRVRVTINFVQAQPENHLLAQSFEKDATKLFEIQQDVARAVAGSVRIRLPNDQVVLAADRQVHPDAQDAYLRGAYLLARGGDADRDQARVYFEKAVEIDPAFARPYAALAIMYAHGGAIRAAGGRANQRLTREWAEKALELDSSLADAHTALAWLAIYDWDFKKAESEFQRAIELNPSHPTAHTWYAQFLCAMHRYPEAIIQAETALKIAPGAPNIEVHAIQAYLPAGRIDEAIDREREILEQAPDYWVAHYFLSLAYMQKHMYAEALKEAEATVAIERSGPTLSLLGSAYAFAGRRSDAERVLKEMDGPVAGRKKVAAGDVVRVYAALGDHEKTLALLEESYREKRPGLALIGGWPQFESLRSDARFQDLLRRIGLPKEPAEKQATK